MRQKNIPPRQHVRTTANKVKRVATPEIPSTAFAYVGIETFLSASTAKK